MNRSLIYVFHKQPKFERFSFFDSGKGLPYYNLEKENTEISDLIDNSIKPWLDALQATPKSSVSCIISGYVLQLVLAKKQLTDQFKKLIGTGQIELVLSPHYDSLSSIISKDLFLKELLIQKALLEELIGSGPLGVMNSATIYSDDLADVLAEMGISYAVAPSLSWYLPAGAKSSPFYKSTNKNLKLALVGQPSEASDSEHEIIRINGFAPEALALLKTAKFNQLSIAKAIEGVSPDDVYSLPDLVAMDISGSGKLEDYLGNNLQKDFLDRLKKLSASVVKPGNADCVKDYLWIGSADHFLKISKREAPAQRYTNFVVLQNMLYDLELKLR